MATSHELHAIINALIQQDKDLATNILHSLMAKAQVGNKQHEAKRFKEHINKLNNPRTEFKKLKLPNSNVSADSFFTLDETQVCLNQIVLCDEAKDCIRETVFQYKNAHEYQAYGLNPIGKILISGGPGLGKTMTARVLANELNLPLFTLRIDSVFGSLLGESNAKLTQIFEFIESTPAVYLFDEFDALCHPRGNVTETNETKRVLNHLLMLLENFNNSGIIVATSNIAEIIDPAIHRRFDYWMEYKQPGLLQYEQLIEIFCENHQLKQLNVKTIASASFEKSLNLSELKTCLIEGLKKAISRKIKNNIEINKDLDPIILNEIKTRKVLARQT